MSQQSEIDTSLKSNTILTDITVGCDRWGFSEITETWISDQKYDIDTYHLGTYLFLNWQRQFMKEKGVGDKFPKLYGLLK